MTKTHILDEGARTGRGEAAQLLEVLRTYQSRALLRLRGMQMLSREDLKLLAGFKLVELGVTFCSDGATWRRDCCLRLWPACMPAVCKALLCKSNS